VCSSDLPTAQTDQGSADDGKGKDEYPHGRLVSARGDDEFTGFAYGAVAAGQGADPVCAAADFGLAISHGERQSGPDHQGQVGQVISHYGDLSILQVACCLQHGKTGGFVLAAQMRSEEHTSELQSR